MQPTEIGELVSDVREHLLYLQELGVESLNVQLSEIKERADVKPAQTLSAPVSTPRENERQPIPENLVFKKKDPEPPQTAETGSRLSALPSLNSRPSRFFDKYNPGDSTESAKTPVVLEGIDTVGTEISETLFEVAPALPRPTETIEQIRAEIGKDCTRCKLATLGRTQVVNSVGNFDADLMFVGEAPGADEDRLGEPFVGKAGQLLTDIIRAIGYERERVFIGNINRCRPPGNRAPEPDESAVCKPFLFREVAVVRPRVIVVLGATAAQNLLETKTPISKMRGHFHDYLGVKVMPTFHPAYLLRDPNKKREVWEDMKKVRDYLKG